MRSVICYLWLVFVAFLSLKANFLSRCWNSKTLTDQKLQLAPHIDYMYTKSWSDLGLPMHFGQISQPSHLSRWKGDKTYSQILMLMRPLRHNYQRCNPGLKMERYLEEGKYTCSLVNIIWSFPRINSGQELVQLPGRGLKVSVIQILKSWPVPETSSKLHLKILKK